uniref:Uncharacterized protein n=1 Tax=Oryza meridionalis TaxID=40149 RepID=A0A0E0E0S4_9ORYZ
MSEAVKDEGLGLSQADVGDVDVPGVRRLKRSWLPQPLLDLDKLFTKQFLDNGREVVKTDGVLVNTFDSLEPVALAALRDGKVIRKFPSVFAVGPYSSLASEMKAADADQSSALAWLNQQPARSMVYVALRQPLPRERRPAPRDRGRAGGQRLLIPVDCEDHGGGPRRGRRRSRRARRWVPAFLEHVRGRAIVTKAWVDQEAVLGHPAVGLFRSHSRWNSVTAGRRPLCGGDGGGE